MKRDLKELSWSQAWHHQSLDLLGMSPLTMVVLGGIVLLLTVTITGIVTMKRQINLFGMLTSLVFVIMSVLAMIIANNVAMTNHDHVFDEKIHGTTKVTGYDKVGTHQQAIQFQAGHVTKTIQTRERLALDNQSEVKIKPLNPVQVKLNGDQPIIKGDNPDYAIQVKDKHHHWVKIDR